MALGDSAFQGGAPGLKIDLQKADDLSPKMSAGIGEERSRKGPRRTAVLPSQGGMVCLSLGGCREGMVSFPAGSSLRPGYLLRQSNPREGPLHEGEPPRPLEVR